MELRARLKSKIVVLLVNGSHVGGDERCTVRCGLSELVRQLGITFRARSTDPVADELVQIPDALVELSIHMSCKHRCGWWTGMRG